MMSRVLVIDETELVRQLYSVMLRGGGYQVQAAASGPEALEHLQNDHFDLVVLDTELSVMGGLEVTRRIRSLSGYSDTPIILIAPMTDTDARLDGHRAGANVYVTKPTQTIDLVLHARLLLGR